MDQFEIIEKEIREKQIKLECLEDNHRRSQRKIAEAYDELLTKKKKFDSMIDSKYQLANHYFQEFEELDITEARHQVQQRLEDYLFMAELHFSQQQKDLEKQEASLEKTYKKEQRQLAEALEQDYRRRTCLAEKQEKES